MAAKKRTDKSTGTTSTKGGTRRKGIKLLPGQDPIIIGGGSVTLEFDKKFKKKTHPSKEKFQHEDNPNLVQVVVIDKDGAVKDRVALARDDQVWVCYTGSNCI